MKICSKCKENKTLDNFHKDSRKRGGLHCWCNKCKYLYNLKLDPEKKQSARLKRTFGITLEQYKDMIKKQDNLCKICNQKESNKSKNNKIMNLAVDHCHKTGKVRGLLCTFCNTRLSTIENEDFVIKAQQYISSFI